MAELLTSRLGYLLKHAQLNFSQSGARALESLGINGRQLAVLVVLDAAEPLSQLDAANELGVDRTTMVALVDELEAKGLVERRRSPDDRRKNIVELTAHGKNTLAEGERRHQETEKAFLADLTPIEADLFVRILKKLAADAEAPVDQPETATGKEKKVD
ncbi:MarR family winged helix-turn-helix transcriptional regulator [Catenulispora pinisilvae]|uniref:MarR family winged helix-turn-helix transcriptional regulator n=1 Tax=Catenulispora pinisilvae TaxID=2705253 RepID=UPI00189163C4|nr:MarR family transcriptional regulator [Catenulispora pinisilvae]